MYENVNERIKVLAVFGKGFKDVRPYRILWGEREFIIKKVGYYHMYKDGDVIWHIFSGTDGVNFFEMKYNSKQMLWLLGRVSDNEVT